MGTPIRRKAFRVPDPTDAIPLSPDGWTTVENLPGGSAPIVTVIANDTDITVAPFNGTTIVIYTALTAPRTLTLPPASGAAQVVVVKDGNELATSDMPILVVPTGEDSTLGITSIVEAHDALGGGIELSFANDSDTTWRSIFDPSASTAVVYDQLQTLIGQLGGTDGDGNVYSIQYDPDAKTLQLQCVTPDPHQSSITVAPNAFDLKADDGTNTYELHTSSGTNAQIIASVVDTATENYGGVFSASSDPGSELGVSFLQGVSASHVAQIQAQATDIGDATYIAGTIDGLTVLQIESAQFIIAPETTPEGDPHIRGALFTSGYVEGVSAGSLMISAG